MGNGFQVTCYISSKKQVTSLLFLITEKIGIIFNFKDGVAFALVLHILGTVTILLDLQSNGVMVPFHDKLLFVVTSNYFFTFKISVTSNCNGTVTLKNGYRFISSELLLQVTEETYLIRVHCVKRERR